MSEWSLAAVVQALQALWGIRLVAGATLVAEIGDITRFSNPRQLMAYLGLVPSEHWIGSTRRQGGITKAGNGTARRMLIEAAWSYPLPARLSREKLLRREHLAKPIRDRVEGTTTTVPTLSEDGTRRKTANGHHCGDRSRAGRLRLGNRPASEARGSLRVEGNPGTIARSVDTTTGDNIQFWARLEARSRYGEHSRMLSAGYHPTLGTGQRTLRDEPPVRR